MTTTGVHWETFRVTIRRGGRTTTFLQRASADGIAAQARTWNATNAPAHMTAKRAGRHCPCCGRSAFHGRAGWECLGCGWTAAIPDSDCPPLPVCPDCGEPVSEADGWTCGCNAADDEIDGADICDTRWFDDYSDADPGL